MKKNLLLSLLIPFLCACGTLDYYNSPDTPTAQEAAKAAGVWQNGHPDNPVVQKTLDESVDTLWPIVLQYVADQGYPLAISDKRAGSIVSDYKTSSNNISYWAKCDYSVSYTQYRSKLSVLLVKNGNKTIVRPVALFDAYNKTLGWVPCYSNGAAENGVFHRIINSKSDNTISDLNKMKEDLQQARKDLQEASDNLKNIKY